MAKGAAAASAGARLGAAALMLRPAPPTPAAGAWRSILARMPLWLVAQSTMVALDGCLELGGKGCGALDGTLRCRLLCCGCTWRGGWWKQRGRTWLTAQPLLLWRGRQLGDPPS